MGQVILTTGASSGFGALTVRALAHAGHTVYAGMRNTAGSNTGAVSELAQYATEHSVDLRAVELDVADQASADAAAERILTDEGRIDAIVHNAGHMVLGPVEAFSAEQLAQLYDVNVIGAHRVNQALLPAMREQGDGLLLWVGSTSTLGGTPPFLGPYFAAKSGLDALAVSYGRELSRFGIDTAIVVPGAFTSGTNHFAHAGTPVNVNVAEAYAAHYDVSEIEQRLAGVVPADADVSEVAAAIVALVDAPKGQRRLRTHIDPSQDGSEVVSVVADRIRAEFLRRIGLDDLVTADSSL
jgi:NAD(P)-dependent dehydrogenase (short-subunit alcohol dehydrogenase family)